YTLFLQLQETIRVDEQPAEAERVRRGESSRVDHRREVPESTAEARLRSRSGCLELRVGNESIERVVLPHRGHLRPGQLDAELPVHPLASALARRVRERAVCRVRELACPRGEDRFPSPARDLIERVHPLRQVMEVLTVAVPLESLIDRLVRRAL